MQRWDHVHEWLVSTVLLARVTPGTLHTILGTTQPLGTGSHTVRHSSINPGSSRLTWWAGHTPRAVFSRRSASGLRVTR